MYRVKKALNNQSSYFIAEVGQNHQGSLEQAVRYIHTFAAAGADAIKFQARDNKYLFSADAYDAQYNSENAFADTYGAHRESLELSKEEFSILKRECKLCNVAFMCTPFDEPSLEMLVDLDVDLLKISSFDIGNLPFVDKVAATKRQIVMSVGGASEIHVNKSIETIFRHHHDVVILHCVSEYPCPYDRLGLSNIPQLQQMFPDLIIGLSDHFNGISSGPVAYMLGARVFEKHVTTDRAQKGTDHSFALEPEGFRKFVRDTQRVPEMMQKKPKHEIGNEQVFQKLGKSLVVARNLPLGAEITIADLSGRIFPDTYVPVRESHRFIGSKTRRALKAGEVLCFDDVIFDKQGD